ncbi:MAG TPA: DUF5991 domain-containing protein [Pyrinomonadaceae bacterium]|jgi:hypothetical protein
MKLFSKFLVSSVLVLFISFAAHAQKEWLGSYTFDEDGGKTAGGAAIFIAHRIDVVESDDGLIATLQSNGFQTSKDLLCTTKTQGGKLLIYFDSYGENNTFEPYEKGDLLLTLERKTVKGKEEILTFWGKFAPSVPKNEKTGKVYFQKTTRE